MSPLQSVPCCSTSSCCSQLHLSMSCFWPSHGTSELPFFLLSMTLLFPPKCQQKDKCEELTALYCLVPHTNMHCTTIQFCGRMENRSKAKYINSVLYVTLPISKYSSQRVFSKTLQVLAFTQPHSSGHTESPSSHLCACVGLV